MSLLLCLHSVMMPVFAGDIGTSPLYVMSSTFYANDGAPRPSANDVVGVTSLIVWTITWIVVRCLRKYRFVTDKHNLEKQNSLKDILPSHAKDGSAAEGGQLMYVLIHY